MANLSTQSTPTSTMYSGHRLLLLLLSTLISGVFPHSLLKLHSGNRKILKDDLLYCRSWSFTVEANDVNPWSQVPARCTGFVSNYFSGDQYVSDSDMVSGDSLAFARTVEVAGDGKDTWIFDVDETLLSNLPYYADNGFGTKLFDPSTFNAWVDLGECPAVPGSLKLYNELRGLGFSIFLLTGRDESQRNSTVNNLLSAGYHDWKRLILRGPLDQGTTAVEYKSGKRNELEAEGYRIHGSSGDQWSDLIGSPTATRSFKLPNPMYYIS